MSHTSHYDTKKANRHIRQLTSLRHINSHTLIAHLSYSGMNATMPSYM